MVKQDRNIMAFMDVCAHSTILRRKRRGIDPEEIESIIDILKNKLMLQHTRHCSVVNFVVHIVSTLVAYALREHKPRVRFEGS